MILAVGRSQEIAYSNNTGDLALFFGDVYFLLSRSVVISKDFESFVGLIFKPALMCLQGSGKSQPKLEQWM